MMNEKIKDKVSERGITYYYLQNSPVYLIKVVESIKQGDIVNCYTDSGNVGKFGVEWQGDVNTTIEKSELLLNSEKS